MDFEKVAEALRRKGYSVSYFENANSAAEYLDREIDNLTVGFGDSATVASMALNERLRLHNTVFDPASCADNDSFVDIAKSCLTTEVFLTSVNAMSESGEMVNIDGTGNRIAGSLFGHKKVYFVVSSKKITATLEDAIQRARNIAAPENAKRLGLKTPCAIKGDRCYNCSSPERICNAMLIYFRKMDDIDAEVVLIDEPLGY